MIDKIKNFLSQIRRVLLVSSKPDKEEFKQSAKITGMGIVIIGIIGFLVFMAFQLMGGV
jgi:protein transport protein SEC61 subunit gamma-like protein